MGDGIGGQDAEDDVVGVGVFEERVGDVFDLEVLEAEEAFARDDLEDAGGGAVEALGDVVDGRAVVEGLDDGLAVESAGEVFGLGEDGGFGEFAIVLADEGADGFGGAVEFVGDAARDVFDAASAVDGQAAGEGEDGQLFVIGEMAEGGGALDALLVVGGELRDGGGVEAEAAAAVGLDEALGDQALLAPALDGFGGDGEFFGDFIECEDGIVDAGGNGVFDFDGEGIGEEFDQRGEIGTEDVAGDVVIGMGDGLEAGDAEMDEVPGVSFSSVDVGHEGDGSAQLLVAFIRRGVGELRGQLEDFIITPRGHRHLCLCPVLHLIVTHKCSRARHFTVFRKWGGGMGGGVLEGWEVLAGYGVSFILRGRVQIEQQGVTSWV